MPIDGKFIIIYHHGDPHTPPQIALIIDVILQLIHWSVSVVLVGVGHPECGVCGVLCRAAHTSATLLSAINLFD